MSDFKHDYVRAYKTPLADADPARLRALFDEMSRAGRDTLAREGVTRRGRASCAPRSTCATSGSGTS